MILIVIRTEFDKTKTFEARIPCTFCFPEIARRIETAKPGTRIRLLHLLNTWIVNIELVDLIDARAITFDNPLESPASDGQEADRPDEEDEEVEDPSEMDDADQGCSTPESDSELNFPLGKYSYSRISFSLVHCR